MNNNITYNGENNMLLNANLCMSFVDTKQAICHGLWWNYNNVEVDITWKSKVEEHQYYFVSIVNDVSFKTLNDSSIQSRLNMIELYVGS